MCLQPNGVYPPLVNMVPYTFFSTKPQWLDTMYRLELHYVCWCCQRSSQNYFISRRAGSAAESWSSGERVMVTIDSRNVPGDGLVITETAASCNRNWPVAALAALLIYYYYYIYILEYYTSGHLEHPDKARFNYWRQRLASTKQVSESLFGPFRRECLPFVSCQALCIRLDIE